ncbi:MAG: dockerin type I domain-containing protein, partial [Anaerolineae bacterium]
AYINAIALEEITTVPTSACIGDFNNDGSITISDVQAVAVRWNTTCSQPLYDRRYDLDADCDIDILDVQRVAYRWNTQCVTEGSTAPIGQPGYRPPTSPPPPAVVSVETNGAPVVAGTEFTVTVAARDVFNLGGFEFTLVYDPAILQAITATLAPFPASGGRPFSAPAPVIDQATGRITFGAFSLGALPGVSGVGALASVRLHALGSGVSALHLDAAQVANTAGGGLRTETTDAQITVSGCAGDVNGDGEVSVTDIQAVSEHWGAQLGQPAYASLYDLDGDGDIDVADAQWVAGRFGAQCSNAVKTEVR